MEKVAQCPVCGHQIFKKYLLCKDYTVSQESFQIVTCQNCNFRFTNPRPAPEAIGQYYQSEAYISHSNTRKGLVNQLYHVVRKRALKGKLKLINRLGEKGAGQSEKKLLDYGCGTGYFLKTAQEDGWKVDGLEPDPGARAQARDLVKQDIQEDIFSPYFEDKRYSVISLWHVLEHVHLLNETIQKLKNRLEEGGKLLIAVPNHLSWEAGVYQEYWAGYDVPRHLYHFSPDTMQRLLEKNGLGIQEKIPMVFDAFYVSLLSGKYKSGRMNFPMAFSRGLWSNLKARRDKNYSSLIYVAHLLK